MDIKEYGIRIKEARTKKGMSQMELAEQCHLGLRTVQRIETGKVSPRIQTVKILNEFLGIQLSNYNELNVNRVNYKSLFYLGIAVLSVGIIFTVAINPIMGIALMAVGMINLILGLRNKETW